MSLSLKSVWVNSTCIFKGIFEELEIINDAEKHLSHQNWTLSDHQQKVKNHYEDVSGPQITKNISTAQMGFLLSFQNN